MPISAAATLDMSSPAGPLELWFTTARLTIHVPQAASAAGVSLIEHHMARDFTIPLHIHADEDESFFVFEGEVRFQADDAILTLGVGDSLHVPADQPHSFRVLSPEARFLTISTGRFEEMVRGLARPAAIPGALPPQAAPTETEMAALVETCRDHGIEFCGPPVA